MNRGVAAKRRAGELGAAIGDDFIDVHVELRAAAGHPDVQREHVVVLACQYFIAGLHDQLVSLIVEPLASVVGDCGGFLQRRVGRDHLARNQILSDAEMLKGPLRLRAPELVCLHFHDAEAVGLFSRRSHDSTPVCYLRIACHEEAGSHPNPMAMWLKTFFRPIAIVRSTICFSVKGAAMSRWISYGACVSEMRVGVSLPSRAARSSVENACPVSRRRGRKRSLRTERPSS